MFYSLLPFVEIKVLHVREARSEKSTALEVGLSDYVCLGCYVLRNLIRLLLLPLCGVVFRKAKEEE